MVLPVSAHSLILVTRRPERSPPRFHILKLGGLLSKFKAHFDRIRICTVTAQQLSSSCSNTHQECPFERVGSHGNVTAGTPRPVCWTSMQQGGGLGLWLDWAAESKAGRLRQFAELNQVEWLSLVNDPYNLGHMSYSKRQGQLLNSSLTPGMTWYLAQGQVMCTTIWEGSKEGGTVIKRFASQFLLGKHCLMW